MDLAKFLEARIADDEAAAKAAFGPGIALNWPALPAAVDVFVDRYGPLRAVREADAKRKILAAYVELDGDVELQLGDNPVDHGVWAGLRTACRLSAGVYSDHPDYDEGWRL